MKRSGLGGDLAVDAPRDGGRSGGRGALGQFGPWLPDVPRYEFVHDPRAVTYSGKRGKYGPASIRHANSAMRGVRAAVKFGHVDSIPVDIHVDKPGVLSTG